MDLGWKHWPLNCGCWDHLLFEWRQGHKVCQSFGSGTRRSYQDVILSIVRSHTAVLGWDSFLSLATRWIHAPSCIQLRTSGLFLSSSPCGGIFTQIYLCKLEALNVVNGCLSVCHQVTTGNRFISKSIASGTIFILLVWTLRMNSYLKHDKSVITALTVPFSALSPIDPPHPCLATLCHTLYSLLTQALLLAFGRERRVHVSFQEDMMYLPTLSLFWGNTILLILDVDVCNDIDIYIQTDIPHYNLVFVYFKIRAG